MKTIKFEQGARVSIHLYYIVIIDIKQTVRHMSSHKWSIIFFFQFM